MNHCVFMGNLTRDPELNEKVGVVNFSIAITEKYKKKDGTEVKDTVYLDMEAWDSTPGKGSATIINKYFKKGHPIIVECKAKIDSWEDKQSNQKRSRTKFRVEKFFFPLNKPKNAVVSNDNDFSNEDDENQNGGDFQEDNNDDTPF